MTCTACGETNRESARFCAGCGAPMHLACSECEATLSPRAKFCDQCGTPVVSTPPSPTTVDDAVRKTITVLFADLVGSTSFQEKVDAETTRSEMASYHQLAQSVIERHGGQVAKFIGDGVMAVFGVPDVAEDDADRAVRSGVALQTSFAPIADRLRSHHGVEVGLRIGINSGEVVVAEADDDMYGDALNTAARLEAECTPGRVLVGEQTWRLTRSMVTYEVLGEVTLKGKEDPVATFQVVEATEQVDEIQAPFVGRDHEINALIEAVDASIEERSPVLVTVIGSPGVGKTRLAAEARAVAAPHAQTFDLRVDRAATSTFGPIADLVRRVIDVDESAEPAQVVDRIAEWIGDDGNPDELAPLLATFIGAGPARSTEESFWASRRLIEILAHRRPTLIVVDDIQWAQPLFLDLLDHLVEWVTGPAALICLARPEIREIRPALAEPGRRVYDVVSLEGLAAGATAELAAGLLGADELPRELADRLPESTEGNPLFVRELVRMLVDDGVVEQVGGSWQLAIDADAVEVPPTIQSLLASRVERMPADERRVVELASVVGSEFARGAIASLLPAVERPGLDTLLERLRRKEIIDPTGTYWGDEPILRFHHVLIRDASYRRMLKQRRADLHLAVGEWTADAADRFGGEHEISIGFHYEQAHLLLTELGRTDDATDLGRRAASLFRVAAERALAQDDLAAAGSLASRALACIDGPRDERAALLLVACEAFFSAGNVHEGEPHLTELRELVADDDRLSAWADAFEGQRIWATDPDRLNEIQPVVAAAAERLAELGDDAGVAKARFVQAIVLARLGRVGDCESELDAALTAARAADDRRRVTAVLGAAPQAALWGPSPVARAGGRCLDIIRLLRITSASPMVEATSVRCQAVLEAMRGRFDQARDLIARSRETVEELGLRHGILETAMYAGIIELYADEPAAAEPFLRDAHAGFGRMGVGADAGQAAALLSEALLAQGRVDEAAELADESVRLAGQNQRAAIASRAAQARIGVAQGRLDDAATLAQEAVDLAAGTDLTMDHARAASTLAQVHERQGQTSSAAADAARLFEAKGAESSRGAEPRIEASAPPEASELENLAIERIRDAARRAEGREDRTPMLAEGFEYVDHRSAGVLTLDGDALEAMFDTVPDERPVYSITPIAVRGTRYGLARQHVWWRDADIADALLILTATDDRGYAQSAAAFDPGDLRAALTELNRLYIEGEGAAFAEPIRLAGLLAEATEAHDHERMVALFAPTAEFVDDRVTMTVHEAGTFPDLAAAQPADTAFVSRMAAINEHGFVGVSVRSWTEDGSLYSDPGACLMIVRDGLIQRYEDHQGDDLPQLLERFAHLTVRPASRLGNDERSGLWNTAVERGLERAAGMSRGEVDPPEGRHPEFRLVDNRAHAPAEVFEHDHADALFDHWVAKEQVVVAAEPVAIRGDRLALFRNELHYPTEEIVIDSVFVLRVTTEGQIDLCTIFDREDLRAALDELNRLYLEDEGAPYRDIVEVAWALGQATEAGDDAAFAAALAEDLVFVDHRSMGVMLDTMRFPAAERSDVSVLVPEYLRVSADAILLRRCGFESARAGDAEREALTLLKIEGGLVTTLEYFDPADEDRAIARFEELTVGTGRLNNLAIEWSDRCQRLMVEGRVDESRAQSLDDFELTDHRFAGQGEDSEAAIRVRLEMGAEFTHEAIATRGDRFGLAAWKVRSPEGFETVVLCVVEVNHDGLGVRVAQFDEPDLAAAEALLNEWFTESLPSTERQHFLSWHADVQLFESGDVDAFAARIPDNLTVTDHRPAGFGTIDRAGWIERFASFYEIAPNLRVSHPAVHRVSASAILATQLIGDNDGNEWSFLILAADRLGHLEFFDVDALAAAERRFEELSPRERVSDDDLTEFERFWTPFEGAIVARDWTRLEALVSPDLAGRSNRVGWGGWEYTREGLVTILRETIDMFDGPGDREVLTVLDGRLALVHWYAEADDNVFDLVSLIQVTDGVMTRLDTWDTHALDDAYEALVVACRAGLSPAERRIIEAVARSIAAVNAHDADGVRATTPHTWVDHRAGEQNFGRIDRAAYVRRQQTLWEMSPGVAAYGCELHALSADGVLGRMVVVDDSGNRWDMHMLITFAGSEPVEGEIFDLVDLDVALARFDELAAVEQPTTAERVTAELVEAINAERWDDVAALVADDFHHRSSRVGFGGTELDKGLFIESLRQSRDMLGLGRVETVTTRGDRIAVHRLQFGGEDIDVDYLVAQRLDASGQLERSVTFDLDGLSRALATADEWYLAPPPSGPGLTNATSPDVRNLAEQHIEQHRMLTELSRFDDLYDLYASDWQFIDRRTAGLADGATVDDVIDALRSRSEWSTDYSFDTIAVRGERLALFRVRMTAESGFEHQNLWVLETDEQGRNRWSTQFDEGELQAALRTLRSRWLEGEGAPHRSIIDATDRMGAALQRPGGTDLAAAVTDDFALVDNRPVGFGDMTIDQYIASIPQIQERGNWLTFATRYDRLNEHGLVLTLASEVETESGVELDGQRVVLFLVQDGLVGRMEWFDVDDLAAAEARFDELTTPEANRAATAMAEGFAAAAALDAERAIAGWHENARGSDLRPLFYRTRMTKTDAADGVRQVRAESSDDSLRSETSTLATRGDDLALVSTHFLWDSREFEITRLDVVRVDGDGLIVRWCTFDPDQEAEAIATLDRWAAAGELLNDALDLTARFWHLVLVLGDSERADALNGPEFETIDRRRLVGGEDLDADGARHYTELIRSRDPGTVDHHITAIDIDGEDRALYRQTAQSADGTWSYDHIQAIELDADGLARRVVTYSVEDEGVARAEFRAGAASDSLSNAASEWAKANVSELTGARVIGTLFDRTALLHAGAPEAQLHVATLDGGGTGTITSFSAWELVDAHQIYADHAHATLPAPAHAAYTAVRSFLFSLLDPERSADFVTESYTHTDHRTGSLLDGDGDQLRRYREAAADAGPSLYVTRRIIACDGAGMLLERHEVTDDYEWRDLILFRLEDGLVAAMELFDVEDEARALARFQETARNRAAEIVIEENRELYVDKVVPADVRSTLVTFDYSPFRAFDLNDDANFRQWFDEMVAPFEIDLTTAVLDTVGDHLVLLRVTLNVEGVDFPVELLQLSRTDDVQSRQTALFDVAAEDAARALLAEWAAAS